MRSVSTLCIDLDERICTAAALLLAAYVVLAAALPPGGFFSSDQGVKYTQVEAIARAGTLRVGRVDEPASTFAPSSPPFLPASGADYQAKFSVAFAIMTPSAFLLFGTWGLVLPGAAQRACAFASGWIG